MSDVGQGDRTDVRVVVVWEDAGAIRLDAGGRLLFSALPSAPGLYRVTLATARPRVYIGEADDLRRRAQGYRTPGRDQQTNLRIEAMLREQLAAGGAARLAIATSAMISVDEAEGHALDLGTKAARVLAEHAALVAARLAGEPDIANAG